MEVRVSNKILVWLTFILGEIMLLGAISAGCVQAQGVSYSGSMQYATGSYFFDESTQSFSLVNGFGWSGNNLTINVNVPFIIQNSPWISYGPSGYIPTGGPQNKVVGDSSRKGSGRGMNRMMGSIEGVSPSSSQMGSKDGPRISLPDTVSYTESSFGDPSLYANLKLYSSFSGDTRIQLNTGLKFPFADPTSGFSTGEWDFGAGLSASQRVNKYFFVADLMKWWFGDLPDLELKDPITYSFGVGRSLAAGTWLVNASFNGYTEIIENYDPPMTLGFGIGYFASGRVSLNSTLSFGLTQSSSDFSIGFGWNVKL